MQRKNILLLVLFLTIGCFLWLFFSFHPSFKSKTSYCVQVPVSFFPFSRSPLIRIAIEKKQYTCLVDTGSSHTLDLHKRALDQIQGKKFLKISQYSDMQGVDYPVSAFRMPEVTLHHKLRLDGVVAHEENIDFLTKGTNAGRPRSLLGKIKNQFGLFFIDGRIGWPAFEQAVCLFDFQNGSLFLAKNRALLEEEGIFKPFNFIKVPLELSRCGPVLSVQTELGVKKFLLDTGASHSAYKESALQSKEGITLTMRIEDFDMGSWDFLSFPIKLDLISELDGVLGIDFFKTHIICFDFQEMYIYILKHKKDLST